MRKNNASRYAFGTLILTLVVSPATLLSAADSDADASSPAVSVGKPTGLSLQPGKFELKGRRARRPQEKA